MSDPVTTITAKEPVAVAVALPLKEDVVYPSLIDNDNTMDAVEVDDTNEDETNDDNESEPMKEEEIESPTITITTSTPKVTHIVTQKKTFTSNPYCSAIDVTAVAAAAAAAFAADNNNNNSNTNNDENTSTCCHRFRTRLVTFYGTNEFLILIVIVILLAKAYPPLGAIYLVPQVTATWIAVLFIFLLAGLGLKTEEFSTAFQRLRFNLFVFVYSFGIDSSFVFGVSRALSYYHIINQDLAHGMVIAACLPVTINMCVVLTIASGGDEASAIFNSAFSNLVGVFLSPLLILGYIGVQGDDNVSVAKVFYKLAIRVLLPIIVGQLLKFYCPPILDFVKRHKPKFKQGQQYALVFIVYTVFCRTFMNENNEISVKEIFLMIVFIGVCLGFLMILAWYLLKLLFGTEPKLRVMGLFGCTHKTVAMGIPLINAIYDGNPAIAHYTLPLLIWHPMQLVVGTFLSPRLLAWVVDEEKKKRGSNDDDDDDDDDDEYDDDNNDNDDDDNDDDDDDDNNGDKNVYDNDDGNENVNDDMLDSSHMITEIEV